MIYQANSVVDLPLDCIYLVPYPAILPANLHINFHKPPGPFS
jgi:hypothetical protein